ncbi:DUF3376 domain-containing protein [Mycolicibacterium baixiangningiae]|uniref:DUF3376 domain-containing protein n=1 Tax=Mycolicibacterium baixiangningiae TaxID=2761578 RepID=UPI001865F386|nr:DUF3376 domain-containing protein [Mycolicibacterium baixiangningiae]
MTDGKPYRTMRLALAMRGGVSLAVWIGGAVAELDLFRRACNNEHLGPDPHNHREIRADVYRKLLQRTGQYNKVEIDILAGASAGGLNAVLFGLAQACDTVMDDVVRRTWIEDGGIWELLREPGSGRVESILRGDGRLFEVVRKALGQIAGDLDPATVAQYPEQLIPNGDSPTPRIAVELAATLLDDPRHPERQNRARFSFSKTGGTLDSTYSTIPAPADRVPDEVDVGEKTDKVADTARWRRQMALDRMALAARATSSFPGAFEPARIYAMRSGSAAQGESAPLPSDYATTEQVTVNMARAFLYSAGRNEPFGVVDGGIFDNIPIDRAIRAIQRASASEPSDRSLVYLDPEPPVSRGPAPDAPEKTSAASWVPVIRSSLALKQRQETAGDELSLIREYNDRVLQTRGRLEALAAIMRALRQSAGDPESRTATFVTELVRDESYTQCRIAMDAPRIAGLLTEPWAELCYPPREAVDYVPLPHRAAIRIKNEVALAYNDTSIKWQLSTDVVALLDWVRVLIAWVRALEDLIVDYTLPEDEVVPPLPAELVDDHKRGALLSDLMCWKAALYRWLTVLGEAKHRAVDEVLARPLRSENRTPDDKYPLITSLQESRGAQMSLSITPQLRKLLCEPEGTPEDLDADMYRLLSAPNQFRYPSGESLVTSVRAGLNAMLEQIRERSGEAVRGLYDPRNDPRPPAQTPEWLAYWAESVYPHFYLPPLATFGIEQIAKIFASTGVPDTAHVIRFDTITGDERPRIDVPHLEKAAKAKYLGQWVRKTPGEARMVEVFKDTDGLLTADAKLAGNALNRFGGFFLWHWRENDWHWGRLDAAAGIVRLLANRSKFEGGLPAAGVGQLQAAVNATTDLRREYIELKTKELQDDILAESAEQQAQFIVKQPGRADSTPPPPLVTTVGGESLSVVGPRYRFALASRVVPLVYRALWPGNSSPYSVGGALSRMGNIAIRPVAVALPLVADPLRLAIAVITVLATAGALGVSVTGGFIHGFSAVVLSALGILIAARTWRAGKNWRTLGRKLDSIGRQYPQLDVEAGWASLLRGAHTGRWRAASWVLVACCVSLATVFGMAAARPTPLAPFAAAESILAIVAVILGVQHWLNQRALRIVDSKSAVQSRSRIAMWIVTLAVGVAVAVVPMVPIVVSFLASPAADGPRSSLLAAGVGTAALTAVSLWGWADKTWSACAIAGAAVLGAGVQILLEHITERFPLWDLGPVAVWLVAVSAITQRLPHREVDYGQPPMQNPVRSAAPAGVSDDNVVSLVGDNAA